MNKTVITALGALSVVSCVNQPIKNDKPNIIMLLVDDLGWKDVGFNGSHYYETPNLDRLAQKGVIFTNAYAACAVSSPTRASIQTGRYPSRIGITDWIRARFQTDMKPLPEYENNGERLLKTPSNPYRMELSEVTIAEQLKKAGYFTCHIGKWHLGTDDYYPEKQGYDLNIGGNDMGQPVNYFDPYVDGNGVRFPNIDSRKEGEFLTDRLSDELVNVVNSHSDKPFFINMCFYGVHVPLMGRQELVNKYKSKSPVDEQNNPVYAAMIESIDQAVGKLMQALEKNKVLHNTMIVFFSDNGGVMTSTSNKPLRAGKASPYEGGIREPMFVYWENKIEAGSVCNTPISSIDFLPTFSSIAGVPLPDIIIDGKDISPLFFKGKTESRPLFWHFPHYRNQNVPYSIIRDGDWKLIKFYEGKTFELYNLSEDPYETTDKSDVNQGKVNELNTKLEQWLKETNSKLPIPKDKKS